MYERCHTFAMLSPPKQAFFLQRIPVWLPYPRAPPSESLVLPPCSLGRPSLALSILILLSHQVHSFYYVFRCTRGGLVPVVSFWGWAACLKACPRILVFILHLIFSADRTTETFQTFVSVPLRNSIGNLFSREEPEVKVVLRLVILKY